MSRGRRGGGSGWANGPSLHNGPNLHGLETTLNVCGLAIWSDTAAWTPARAQAQRRARLGRGGARAQSLGRWQALGPHGCGRRMLSVHRAEPAPARSPAPVNATSALAHPRAPGSPPTGVKADSRRRPEPRQLPTQHTAPQATAEGATSLPSGVWRSSPALCPATASLLSGSRRKRDPRWGASECPASGPGVHPPTASGAALTRNGRVRLAPAPFPTTDAARQHTRPVFPHTDTHGLNAARLSGMSIVRK